MSLRRVIGLLGSWWLTAFLLLSLAAVYLVFSFGRNPYPAWVAFIFHTPFGIAIYLGMIINLAAASIRIVLARLRPQLLLTPDSIRAMDIYGAFPLNDAGTLRAAADLLKMPVSVDGLQETGMRQATGTWSFLPGTVFRAGLVLALIGLLVSVHTRKTDDTVLREGENREVQGSSVALTAVRADLPADHLQVGDDGTFLLEGVSAQLAVNGAAAVITPGFPTRINGRWYRIRHLGYAQALTVTVRGQRSSLVADLDLLPPGRSSIVPLPSGRVFLAFSLDPDRTITKGLLKGRQYNLSQPSYRVVAQEGKPREGVTGLRMKPGEQAVVGPAAVALGEQSLSLRIQIVSDPGLLSLYTGLIILLAGITAMASRFFWYEREIAAVAAEGMLLIGSRDEFFKKWGVQRFERWRTGLEQSRQTG